MRALIIDTCLASCSAAVFDPDSGVIASSTKLMDRGHAEAIAPMVKDVLTRSSVNASELSAIAVTIGPGTFTGVRIGLALAQGIGLARGIPLIGVDTMLATAAPLLGNHAIVVVHRAGATGQVYTQKFDASGYAVDDIAMLPPDKIRMPDGAFVVGTGAEMIPGSIRRKPAFDLPDAAKFAAHAVRLPHAKSTLQPLYVREPDAKPQSTGNLDLSIGRVGAEHADALAAIHATSFDKAWPGKDIASMLGINGTIALVATANKTPCGMIIVRAIGDEAEILTLAILPTQRKRGIATRLIRSAEHYLAALQVNRLLLEVAADNEAALALYRRTGFSQSGMRKGYYARGEKRVDAILMRRDI